MVGISEENKMTKKIYNLLFASIFVGTLGMGATAEAVLFTGNTNLSSPTTIATYLSYSPNPSFSLDVPIPPGSATLTNLGTFTLNTCNGNPPDTNNCVQTFNIDGTSDFTLRITFTEPTIVGSQIFTADINGTISASGNSGNIGNGSLLTINFDNTHQTVNYTTASGSGSFELWIDDPLNYTGDSTFGDPRTVIGHIGSLNFTPCTANCVGQVPEPSTWVLVGLGLLVLVIAQRMLVKTNSSH